MSELTAIGYRARRPNQSATEPRPRYLRTHLLKLVACGWQPADASPSGAPAGAPAGAGELEGQGSSGSGAAPRIKNKAVARRLMLRDRRSVDDDTLTSFPEDELASGDVRWCALSSH